MPTTPRKRRRARRIVIVGGLLAGLMGYRQYRLATAPDPASDVPDLRLGGAALS
jgi:hypothetical protein